MSRDADIWFDRAQDQTSAQRFLEIKVCTEGPDPLNVRKSPDRILPKECHTTATSNFVPKDKPIESHTQLGRLDGRCSSYNIFVDTCTMDKISNQVPHLALRIHE